MMFEADPNIFFNSRPKTEKLTQKRRKKMLKKVAKYRVDTCQPAVQSLHVQRRVGFQHIKCERHAN